MQLASFVVSIIAIVLSTLTASGALYLSWMSGRQSTSENISKLIDQYSLGLEKLALLHEETDLNRINIVRSQLQTIASRTVALEKVVLQSDIDDGTRLAIAQINDSQDDNARNAEAAWRAAIENTTKISVYLYAMRNLAANQQRQDKKVDAEITYKSALDAALSNSVRGTAIVNDLLPDARNSQAALTHAYWLDQFDRKDCGFAQPHFDAGLKLISDTAKTGPATDLLSQDRIIEARRLLYRFRTTRESCPPSSEALESADDCDLIANILDNAPAYFNIYQGVQSRSRISFRGPEFCGINSQSTFYCTWPESDEDRTRMQVDKLVGELLQCKNLGDPKVRDVTVGKSQTKNLDLPDRATIRIKRQPKTAGDDKLWSVSLEIDPKVQR